VSDSTPEQHVDYYEILQISPSAEPETINRVFRLFAQRFHPDNKETGDENRFRLVHEAYKVLSEPEQRARYDVRHQQQRQDRWRLVSTGSDAKDNFQLEEQTRLTVLEVLYTHRRLEPEGNGVFYLDLEQLTGRPREHLTFTIWYLTQKGFVSRGDNVRLGITAEGVDYLEMNYRSNGHQRRLQEGTTEGG
jgi:curved DNA-binding protein CbpA